MSHTILKSFATITLFAAPLFAQEPQPGSAPPPDVLKGAVDPYSPGTERALFLKAAGVDSELEESEATPTASGGFVRVFDKWSVMKLFDKNTNVKLDWLEADAYRRALKLAVIGRYDKDRNGKLDPVERAEANKDLAAGKAPPVGVGPSPAVAAAPGFPAPPGTPGGGAGAQRRNPFQFQFGTPGQLPPEVMQFLDKDGDGQISQPERIGAYKQVRGMGIIALNNEYDKNKDGVIDDEERAKMISPVRLLEKLDKMSINAFDDNGDGQLDDAELVAADDFFVKWNEVGQKNALKMMDEDGDGQVGPLEQRNFETMIQSVMLQTLPKAMSWADDNGDGQATPEEWLGLVDKFSAGLDVQVAGWGKRFDANGDGRFNAAERDEWMKGMMADDEVRMKKHDADGNGRLNAKEMMTLIDDVVGEWGIKPAKK